MVLLTTIVRFTSLEYYLIRVTTGGDKESALSPSYFQCIQLAQLLSSFFSYKWIRFYTDLLLDKKRAWRIRDVVGNIALVSSSLFTRFSLSI